MRTSPRIWLNLLAGLWFAHAFSTAAAEPSPTPRPNVIFILADDLGYGDLACYGRPDIRTPNLDRLAEQGVRFTQHYANGPECTPTRAAFLTGRYPQWIGGLECAIGTGNVGRYDDAIRLREKHALGLPASVPTLPRWLKRAGYVTAITGKWHLGYEPQFAPHHHGFDYTFYCVGGGMDYFHYVDTAGEYNLFQHGKPVRRQGYFTDLATDEAIGFIRRHAREPFFLYLPYTAPHAPFQGPNDARPEPLPPDSPLWQQGKAPPRVYVTMIERMDQCIGRLLAEVDALGLRERTVVIFASDNGGTASARNTPLRGIKGSTFEGGIRVPAIARWPGVLPAGKVSRQPCITFDFTASIVRLASAEPPPDHPLEGMDILAHAAAERPDAPRTLFWRKPRGTTLWKGVRQGDLKYVGLWRNGHREEHLFDLAADLSETHDLKTERPADFKRLQQLFNAWEQRTRAHRRGRPESELQGG